MPEETSSPVASTSKQQRSRDGNLELEIGPPRQSQFALPFGVVHANTSTGQAGSAKAALQVSRNGRSRALSIEVPVHAIRRT